MMFPKAFVIYTKVMAKGQITIPKEIHDVLSVLCGDQVAFVAAGNTIRMVNSAVYSMQTLQWERKSRNEGFD